MRPLEAGRENADLFGHGKVAALVLHRQRRLQQRLSPPSLQAFWPRSLKQLGQQRISEEYGIEFSIMTMDVFTGD